MKIPKSKKLMLLYAVLILVVGVLLSDVLKAIKANSANQDMNLVALCTSQPIDFTMTNQGGEVTFSFQLSANLGWAIDFGDGIHGPILLNIKVSSLSLKHTYTSGIYNPSLYTYDPIAHCRNGQTKALVIP